MLYIAGDKHGYEAIKMIGLYLKNKDVDFENLGVQTIDEDLSLEKMIPAVAKNVVADENNKGILICGTGVGVEIGANKFGGIRACLATNEKVAEWSRKYDDANVLCLTGWDIDHDQLIKTLDAWFQTEFEINKKTIAMLETFSTWH